jgi:hypothetical protein
LLTVSVIGNGHLRPSLRQDRLARRQGGRLSRQPGLDLQDRQVDWSCLLLCCDCSTFVREVPILDWKRFYDGLLLTTLFAVLLDATSRGVLFFFPG